MIVRPNGDTADIVMQVDHAVVSGQLAEAWGGPHVPALEPRASVIAALKAEGIHCSGGYPLSLHHQPMFQKKAFGPYLAAEKKRLDYRKTQCPNSDRICREQGLWLEQSTFLGSRADMEHIVAAFAKVHEHRDALAAWAKRQAKS